MRKLFAHGVVAAALLGVVLPQVLFGASTGSIENPLRYSTISQFINGLLEAVVYIALPIISLFIVYAGFLFVTARGDAAQISKARNNFLYVVIGALLILGAWALAELIGGTIEQLRS